MKIALFALTGFGNGVLKALKQMPDVSVECLVTRKENGPYPYYPETDIFAEAQKLGVPAFYGAEGEGFVTQLQNLDLILCASYHRILKRPLFEKAKYAINLHPSLLPQYRGPTPCFWVLRNNEPYTGITAHFLTEQADEGDIVLQEQVAIDPWWTQSDLRRHLSQAMAVAARKLIPLCQSGAVPRISQASLSESYFKRPQSQDICFDDQDSDITIKNILRAATPWPGAQYNGQLYTIKNIGSGTETDKKRFSFSEGDLRSLYVLDKMISLELKESPKD